MNPSLRQTLESPINKGLSSFYKQKSSRRVVAEVAEVVEVVEVVDFDFLLCAIG